MGDFCMLILIEAPSATMADSSALDGFNSRTTGNLYFHCALRQNALMKKSHFSGYGDFVEGLLQCQ